MEIALMPTEKAVDLILKKMVVVPHPPYMTGCGPERHSVKVVDYLLDGEFCGHIMSCYYPCGKKTKVHTTYKNGSEYIGVPGSDSWWIAMNVVNLKLGAKDFRLRNPDLFGWRVFQLMGYLPLAKMNHPSGGMLYPGKYSVSSRDGKYHFSGPESGRPCYSFSLDAEDGTSLLNSFLCEVKGDST